MQFNIIYNNSGPRTPTGATQNQNVAGLNNVGIYLNPVPFVAQTPTANDPYAPTVIQSNGENIGNAKLKSNPLPPGIT
jgi:hypothetical protein